MSSVSQVCRKRRLNGAVSRNNRKKGWPRVGVGRARYKTLRNVYGVGSPTVGSTSSSVRMHICAVTCLTEISLHVT